MKIFILVFSILACMQNASAEDLGKQVNAYVDHSEPKLGLTYSYDIDTLWVFTVAIWAGDIVSNSSMKTLSWRLFDSKSGSYINNWTTAVDSSSPVKYPGTMAFSWYLDSKKEALAAIATLSNLKVVLSVDQDLSAPKPTHFIDLGSYCISNPNNFSNLTTGGTGCKVD